LIDGITGSQANCGKTKINLDNATPALQDVLEDPARFQQAARAGRALTIH